MCSHMLQTDNTNMHVYKGPPYARIRIHGYRCEWPAETPCKQVDCTQGCLASTPVKISKPLIKF